jgi:transcription initiation factor TFIIB
LVTDYERAEVVCDDCGLVVDHNIIDEGAEWRAFDSEQRLKRSRVGSPMSYLIHDKGLSTVIDWKNKDFLGNPLPSRTGARLYRMRKWQQRIKISNTRERNLLTALVELNKIASKLGVPKNVRETAALLYRRAMLSGSLKGRSIENVVAASLYAACRQCSVPRTLDEIAQGAGLVRRDLGRTYRYLCRELTINLDPTTPLDYVPRFCSELNLNQRVQTKAIEILRKAIEKQLTAGRTPTGSTAAAIYIASVLVGENRTQREIANVAGITEVTIRNRYKEIAEKLDIDVTV